MGLLDQILSPQNSDANLALAAGLLQGNFAGGLLGMSQARAAQQDRAMRQKALESQLLGQALQQQQVQLELDQARRKISDTEADRAAIRKFYGVGGLPGVPGLSPTVNAALPGDFKLPAVQTPAGGLGGVPASAPAGGGAVAPKSEAWQRYKQAGDYLMSEGRVEAAQKQYDMAEKFRPKYNTTPQQMINPETGKLSNYLVSEDGTRMLMGEGVKPNIKTLTLGNRVESVDENNMRGGETFAMGQSPDNAATVAATIRGQNMTDARSRDANAIAQIGKVTDNSTGLRKEFENLPEVKNYKQALPSYKAIEDAVKRNTPQADINIVYGLAKLYDPNSVVREGEYATVANSPNIPERIKGYAQYINGGGKLSPVTKAQILAEAQGRIKSYEDQYASSRNDFERISQRSGADTQLVFPKPMTPAVDRSAAPPVPMKGMTRGGYRFKGGDPADKNNWEKM